MAMHDVSGINQSGHAPGSLDWRRTGTGVANETFWVKKMFRKRTFSLRHRADRLPKSIVVAPSVLLILAQGNPQEPRKDPGDAHEVEKTGIVICPSRWITFSLSQPPVSLWRLANPISSDYPQIKG